MGAMDNKATGSGMEPNLRTMPSRWTIIDQDHMVAMHFGQKILIQAKKQSSSKTDYNE